MSSPPFGIIPAGHPLQTVPSSSPGPGSFLYALPSPSRPFAHLVVFLLPDVALPPDTAAAIYLATADQAATATQPQAAFRFLGAIGSGKESAVFRVGDATMPAGAGLVLGISLEPAADVATRLLESRTAPAVTMVAVTSGADVALLAQRIISNAFTFLASFSGSLGPGQPEVVPLRAFEDWWRKFEGRIRSDPGFLERQVE